MDQMVAATQEWLNKTYTGRGGYSPIDVSDSESLENFMPWSNKIHENMNKLILVKHILALLGYFNTILGIIKGAKTLTLTYKPP